MAKNGDLCRICGEGHLTVQVEKNPVEYKGVSKELDSFYSVCDGCGSEQADAAQARANKRLMIAFKKQIDGLLVGADVRKLRHKFGLSQAEASEAFGGGPVAFSKYESDDVTQSESMDKLLRLADELPSALDLLCRRAGIERVIDDNPWKQAESWKSEVPCRQKEDRPRLRVVSSSSPSSGQQTGYKKAA